MKPVLFLTVFLLAFSGCADAANVDGKISFDTNRYGKSILCILENGHLRKILEGARFASWTSDGKKLLAVANKGVIIFDGRGKNPKTYHLKHAPLNADWKSSEEIIFGSIYDENGERTAGNVYSYNLRTHQETALTSFSDKKEVTTIDVSPDGHYVLFGRYEYIGDTLDFKSYFLELNSNKITEVDRGLGYARWSPDGSLMVSALKDGEIGIYDAKTKTLQSRIKSGILASDPAFSPDGKKIIFNGTWSGIYVINIDGTGLKTILKPDPRGKNDGFFDWAA